MPMSFKSHRLAVHEVSGEFDSSKHSYLIERIPKILTPAVVGNLPPYFHDIASSEQARIWLERMLSESHLLQVENNNHKVIGFLFVYEENDNSAHIGYLLAEDY